METLSDWFKQNSFKISQKKVFFSKPKIKKKVLSSKNRPTDLKFCKQSNRKGIKKKQKNYESNFLSQK